MSTSKNQASERQLLINLLSFFSLEASDQQAQIAAYMGLVAERGQQAHIDDPLVELATHLEIWADRHTFSGIDTAACPILTDLSALIELILRKDQQELASIESLSTKHHWNMVRRFCKEALRLMHNPVVKENSSVWAMLASS